ncbi:ABC transporter permease [Limobrevibacterium gyesilva]|uniref:Iron ABC transporter permease n=1 Tax=Limobrevibacterium gyesilva TaxID=2991712 RepID=A0AA41YLT6_9PROT|nr:iron ABC transporter permease [Limobrevibacterium gyesilva]MCW3474652.1 iron ABC transporter permease [Limobrevibacterium gyesilva]
MKSLGGIAAFRNATTLIALAFLALFLLYPLWLVLQNSLQDEASGQFTLQNFTQILSSPYYLGSFRNSVVAGALSTVLASLIGVPLAFCLARVDLPGKSALMTLASLPLVLPSFVSAYALVLLFGHAGVVTVALRAIGIPIGSIYGMSGIVIVFTLTLYPYVLLPTVAGFRAIDVSIEESGRNLGASRWYVFRTVLLPVVMPAMLAGALLVFIEALENFGVPSVLAEDKPYLAVDIFKLFAGESDSNPAAAGALSVLLVATTALVLLLQRHYLARRRFATGARRAPPAIPLSRPWRLAASVFSWGIVLLSVMPFVAVVVISFLRFHGPVLSWEFGLNNYASLLRGSYQPLYSTLLLASMAALLATLLGAPIGYVLTRHRTRLSGLLDVVGMIPFAVSGTVLAIGLLLAFNSGWLVLTGGWLILVVAYVVRKLPFSIRSASAIVHQIDPSLEEASINLGVSPLKTFVTLTVPLMLGGLAGGMVLIWVTAASELSSTIVLYSSKWATMTVTMFQALQGTGAGEAAAAASILIVFTLVPLLLVYRLLRRHDGSLL